MALVRVALPVPLFCEFDYLYDDDMDLVVGARVFVPFGSHKLVGIVVDFPETTDIPEEQLKEILQALDHENLFPEPLWALLKWGANYYQTPWGEVLNNALPVKLRQPNPLPTNEKTFWTITSEGETALTENKLKTARKQREALSLCQTQPQEKGNNEISTAVWSQLYQKGFIQEEIIQEDTQSWQEKLGGLPIVRQENVLRLNTEQAIALGLLEKQFTFQPWLLEGVTGSGKTEIYLQYIAALLERGKQVLVLVPEIGLTPQTVQRFKARFNVAIDVVHSNINDTERLNVWQRVRTGQTAILIGTRSALLSPFKDLGGIIIDEEHDRSFKQQDGWRYHGRDLAVMYAKILDIPILLGSATPSLETLNNVEVGKYRRLTLKKRAGKGTALHHFVIDMKKQRVQQGLSDALISKIKAHLDAGNQVLLFLNRRGFSPIILCHECGWIAECKHCEKPMTYHQKQRVLRCHHCGNQKPIPMQCEECGSTYLIPTGMGTEQLEENLQKLFPDTPITRIDRDSTARKGQLESRLNLIKQGQSQILIGTQMLAKGHHFPEVTLVALLDIDGALFSVDFRAEEQLAQLYVQVAGRAGRAEKAGEVVLQTHFVDHPLLQTLLKRGYEEFSQIALKQRHAVGLPPYMAQALFRAQSRDSAEAQKLLESIATFFQQQNIPGLQVLPPMPAPMSKKAGQYRWQLLLQHPQRAYLQNVLQRFPHNQFMTHKVRWHLDVDPQDFS